MTITLELTPEQERRVAHAQANGTNVSALLQDTIDKLLPDPETSGEQKPERVLRGRGKYAHLPRILDTFEREKQEELKREEQKFEALAQGCKDNSAV